MSSLLATHTCLCYYHDKVLVQIVDRFLACVLVCFLCFASQELRWNEGIDLYSLLALILLFGIFWREHLAWSSGIG